MTEINKKLIVTIPARLAATRLPNKPLADIHGRPMIVHVWERVVAAIGSIDQVIVAAGDAEIVDVMQSAGGRVVLTDQDLPSGSDRVFRAIQEIEKQDGITLEHIINVQGDLPTLAPEIVKKTADLLQDGSDMASLVAEIIDPREIDNPNVVKAIVSWDEASTKQEKVGRGLYFTRAAAPSGNGPYYHHIGIYGYQRDALEKFVNLPPSTLEKREKLEQLRALEDGMTIRLACVDTIPLGVDTQEDLERARKILQA
jgi:3-deoxy-manno-octulosonate cytidylyltransferase (CMP-KDO synthetase)